MRHLVVRWVSGVSFLLGLVMISSTPALAQDAGIRGGISVDPDQFYFGGHLETPPLVERLYFRPNVEVGVGDEFELIEKNASAVSVVDITRLYSSEKHNADLMRRAIATEALPESWRAYFRKRIANLELE